jgi:type VI secretion system secreted protein Hcp
MRSCKLIVALGLTAIITVALASSEARAAEDYYVIYVTVDGSKQGRFKGEAVRQGFQDKFKAQRVNYELKGLRDSAAGQPLGKRQHEALTIVKDWGSASPQLFSAMATNEVLKTVVIDFFQITGGQEVLHHSIALADATIVDIKEVTRSADAVDAGMPKHPEAAMGGLRHMEDITFTFRQITFSDHIGRTAAVDTWAVPAAHVVVLPGR